MQIQHKNHKDHKDATYAEPSCMHGKPNGLSRIKLPYIRDAVVCVSKKCKTLNKKKDNRKKREKNHTIEIKL